MIKLARLAPILITPYFLAACAGQPRTVHNTDTAPVAIGPYSQMIQAGDFYYVSGTIPISLDGKQVIGSSIEEQTRTIMRYIEQMLTARGLSMGDVVKSNVYLIDLNEFPAFNRIYGEYFPANPPARTTIQVSRLPRDVKVEIAVTAYKPTKGR